ncbi:G-type lectin S-receptor-like serine/threonine-protein kinase SD2-2 [Acorus calamus]|uniref:non-specific serine/threonine protein kinase n=1 Tax=Acorus calamus TaxID=4465 RepID=A0AAV9E5N9_ACOCL|nr:G-type lectin S-receptor-like serine/threonine-protein kinase SD2-2 [Acorus calamus]
MGFFTVDGGSSWFLGIWYASIPIRSYVWVANRRSPVTGPLSSFATLVLIDGEGLTVTDSAGRGVWSSGGGNATEARLLDTGNLVVFYGDRGKKDVVLWQSFDHPSDSWLPEMEITRRLSITCWRSPSDPSPGLYSLRLSPRSYGSFELVYRGEEGEIPYWTTGNWTSGGWFSRVPEMTVPYIYTFRFNRPFTEEASFAYAEALPSPPPTRFSVDPSGQIRQYTWSAQTANWNMFWSRPDDPCRVYGLCGHFGLCSAAATAGGVDVRRPCECPHEFVPADLPGWGSGDFSSGCVRRSGGGGACAGDTFEEVGAFAFEGGRGAVAVPVANRGSCEESCRRNCSCLGLAFDSKTGRCENLYGRVLNLQESADHEAAVLYLRIDGGDGDGRIARWKVAVLSCAPDGDTGLLRRTRSRRLRRGLPRDLPGPSPTPVAVKRLDRPGGGERDFRAEVRTIGSVHHVNLVRLIGFCLDGPHRLLVYDCMRNGPLSAYLRRDHRRENLSWAVRFRIAVGTARGIAYLHEECRDRILHCDIKPENILLDGDYNPKVSDFGLAKLIGRDFSRVLTTMRGTWGYVAPEWISGVAITPKADVYSYGMTLLEIIGGRRNVDSTDDGGEQWFFPPWAAKRIIEGGVADVVDPALGGEFDAAEAERAGLVAVWCIQDEEGARPTMGSVVKMLEGTVGVTTPPPPQLLQALVSGDSYGRAAVGGSGTVSGSTGSSGDGSVGGVSTRGTVGSSCRARERPGLGDTQEESFLRMETELCSSRAFSSSREESGDEELTVLPRHTKVIVTGNNRTKSVLVGLQGVVKKAVGLGGWHWLVLKNGVEVKLQRNALSVLEPPTGNEVDEDDVNSFCSSSDMTEKDHDYCSTEFRKPCKPRVRHARSSNNSVKSISRSNSREIQSRAFNAPPVLPGALLAAYS